jgi:hypothetical protein
MEADFDTLCSARARHFRDTLSVMMANAGMLGSVLNGRAPAASTTAAEQAAASLAFKVSSDRLLKAMPLWKAFAWAARIPGPQRASFCTANAGVAMSGLSFDVTEGWPRFRSAAPAAEYVALTFVQPFPDNRAVYGYNILANDSLSVAYNVSKDNAVPVLAPASSMDLYPVPNTYYVIYPVSAKQQTTNTADCLGCIHTVS